jgi:hypothetical protein
MKIMEERKVTFMFINFVTSFSDDGFGRYAEKMLLSVKEHWHPDLKLTAYYHDCDEELVSSFPQAGNIEYRNLNEVEDMLAYRERMKAYDGTANGQTAYNWRMDAIKWCHKVYALTDYGLELADNDAQAGWLCWIDADTVTTKPLTVEKVTAFLPEKAELVHLGRKDVDYSETSFIGFNLNYEAPVYMIADLRGCYDIGEVVSYREWHDGFIFERLLKIYTAHGMRVQNLTPNVSGLEAFKNSPLSQYMTHYKGALKNKLSDIDVAPDVKLPRYRQLADLIRTYGSETFVEVGTWNGGRAVEMALASFESKDKVHYIGFDLFEEATEELDKYELNSKPHNTIVAVNNRLQEFADKMKEKGKEFTFELHKGDSKETLYKAKESIANANFAFIDGGHSEETVLSDYANLKHCDVIVFDDYFSKDQEGNILADEYLGTNRLVDGFEKTLTEGRCIVLPSQDKVKGGGVTHLALLLAKDDLPKPPASLLKVPIIIKPKDSMPKEYIMDSINDNVALIKKWGFVQTCKPNAEHAIIVSAGPSTNYKELKQVIEQTKGTVFCVKHSYPKLLQNGIDPYACVILDPRSIEGTSTHGVVRKDLFSLIDNKTKFFIASMTDISVTKYLMDKTDEIYGWHAYSEAVAAAANGKSFAVDKKLNIAKDTTFVTGGTCSAMRSIGMAHILGFRNFHLFGFDCSIPKVTAKMKKEKTEDGKPKYLHVETNGKEFWTTGELLAMGQDCEKLFSNQDIEMNITIYGKNTLVSEVFKDTYHADKKYYKELIEQC